MKQLQNNFTTLEQSKRLLELGVPADSAGIEVKTRGRKKLEGVPRKFTIPDDVHRWIKLHGGGRYVTDIVRAIIVQYGR